ncbi:hypothetical protein [Echinicola vietnamensis]|uniref:Uncharacterized protein n=1 Tax=Echinicola vietnamensis (strain DSM 17526 / LMG 23754 / KMM 6221) TaxID=926556 RepID=L0G6Z8_ECHVK|nr:hypothetical protein [Echinicola vietnamensis]AGA80786.1 hypothetical protein Echvi_4614 [Echinicola vietnamensis DSM 17526]
MKRIVLLLMLCVFFYESSFSQQKGGIFGLEVTEGLPGDYESIKVETVFYIAYQAVIPGDPLYNTLRVNYISLSEPELVDFETNSPHRLLIWDVTGSYFTYEVTGDDEVTYYYSIRLEATDFSSGLVMYRKTFQQERVVDGLVPL